MRFHTQTAGCSLTAAQPEVNLVRVTIQALAAVMGGTQSLHTNSMDEAWALPSEKAVRLALRTQQVVAHESGVPNTIDPLGGSYFVEWLTDEMENQTYKYFDRIESLGGVLKAIDKGFFQREIADSAYRYQREIDSKERVIVGVNDFILDEELEIPILAMDEKGEQTQVNRLKRIRCDRDDGRFTRAMDRLRKVAEGDENTMPAILECAKAQATLGDITGVLRDVFGEYVEPSIF